MCSFKNKPQKIIFLIKLSFSEKYESAYQIGLFIPIYIHAYTYMYLYLLFTYEKMCHCLITDNQKKKTHNLLIYFKNGRK